MARVTWKGEAGGPDQIEWKGKTFKKGEAVEIDDNDHATLEKASGNQYFDVQGWTRPQQSQAPAAHVPPSQQGSQFAVPKGGEPVASTPTAPGRPEPHTKPADVPKKG